MSLRLKIAKWLLGEDYSVVDGDDFRQLLAIARRFKMLETLETDTNPAHVYGAVSQVLADLEADEIVRINHATATVNPEPYNVLDIIRRYRNYNGYQVADIAARITENQRGY